ncbi:MAG TPA: hypothetical protein DCQ29_15050 [Chitinophagaceae bacterium]|nr:hypothetical protein [Chitinophagaceae bacterium]
MKQPNKGQLLIADPFLKDANFIRTVVLLCSFDDSDGGFGFVMNRKSEQTLADVLEAAPFPQFPLYYGGPVQLDTLHFIHTVPHLIPDGVLIGNGMYWSGDFDKVLLHLGNQAIGQHEIKFFLGYSGWSEGQLEEEVEEGSWLLTPATPTLVFETPVDALWQQSVLQLGDAYKEVIHYPIDPQLN